MVAKSHKRLSVSVGEVLDLSTLRENLAREDKKLAQLESELQARAEAFRGLQAEIDALRSAMVACPADEIAALQAIVDQRDHELAAHKDHIALLERELAEKAGEASALRAAVQAQQDARAMVETLNARLIEENEQLHRDIESYALVQQNRDNQVSALRPEVGVYQAANRALRAEIEKAREDLARSLDRSKVLEERLTGVESSLEEASQELARSLDRSKILEERLTGMESSTSWKLTRPLRSLSYAARRLAKRPLR
jgi:uncharacterized protein (DUF3084 family)